MPNAHLDMEWDVKYFIPPILIVFKDKPHYSFLLRLEKKKLLCFTIIMVNIWNVVNLLSMH